MDKKNGKINLKGGQGAGIPTHQTGNTPRDFFTGLANVLDDNITSGAMNWVLGKC